MLNAKRAYPCKLCGRQYKGMSKIGVGMGTLQYPFPPHLVPAPPGKNQIDKGFNLSKGLCEKHRR
jgi:hypothetical protein